MQDDAWVARLISMGHVRVYVRGRGSGVSWGRRIGLGARIGLGYTLRAGLHTLGLGYGSAGLSAGVGIGSAHGG